MLNILYINRNTATTQNITNKIKLYDETSVVFGLFIGYLIIASTKHPVNIYANTTIAYLCIQGRGIIVYIGTFSMLISLYITNSVDEMLSFDINPDNKKQFQSQNSIIYSYLKSLEFIQTTTYFVSFICFSVFILTYCLEIFSIYYKQLDFTIFFIILILSIMIIMIVISYINIKKKNTFKSIRLLNDIDNQLSII